MVKGQPMGAPWQERGEKCRGVSLGLPQRLIGPKACIMQQFRPRGNGLGGQFNCENGPKYFAQVIEINPLRT